MFTIQPPQKKKKTHTKPQKTQNPQKQQTT